MAQHAAQLDHAALDRERMVDRQIAARGIDRLARARRHAPGAARSLRRQRGFEEFAYEDSPLPIAEGQTISQPYIVALMIEAAEVKPGDRVLEIGTGSGYAAAVLSRIAGKVYTVERHGALADTAQATVRAARLSQHRGAPWRRHPGLAGGGAVRRHHRDRRRAGNPGDPAPSAQDRRTPGHSRSARSPASSGWSRSCAMASTSSTRRISAPCIFVPLIGEHGWSERQATAATVRAETTAPAARHARARRFAARGSRAAAPISTIRAFGRLFDRFADARVVLLGEATHGTSEFYRARAAITRRLIEQHGFTIVAVEADWPDAAAIDRYVRHKAPATAAEPAFRRFPTWMWRNVEVHDFVDWLRAHNERLDPARRAGFFGLDIYNMSASMRAVIDYLDKVDPEAARVARERYGCLTPWQNDPATYGRAVLSAGYAKCEAPVVAMLRDLFEKQLEYRRSQRRRRLLRCRAERAPRRHRRALLPRHVLRRRRVLEPARPAHVRDARAAARLARRRAPRRSCGRTIPTSAMRRRPTWAWCAARSISANCAGSDSATRCVLDRLRHRPRHGGGRLRLGRADGDQAGSPRAPRQLRAALPRQRRRPVPARPAGGTLAGAAQRARLPAPGAGDRRDLPAGDRARQPLFRRLAAAAVRRLSLVRGDARGDAAADRAARRRAGNLSVRVVTMVQADGTTALHIVPHDSFDDWIVDDSGRELGYYPTREAAVDRRKLESEIDCPPPEAFRAGRRGAISAAEADNEAASHKPCLRSSLPFWTSCAFSPKASLKNATACLSFSLSASAAYCRAVSLP